MFAGPIFSREFLISPRQLRHFLIRSGYVSALFVLMYTAGQSAFGWQEIRNLGDFSRFGSFVFRVFAFMQLSLVLFFALLFAAGNVAQEKDRRTLVLLLMTDLRNRELVLGKLSASLLLVAVLLVASIPVFVMVQLLGGVSLEQVIWALLVCAATGLAAGSWGSMVAFWREKTFQTLAIGVLGAVLFIGFIEAAIGFSGSESAAAYWIGLFNPYRGMLDVLNPLGRQTEPGLAHVSAFNSVFALMGLAAVLNAVSIYRLRAWNTERTFERAKPEGENAETPGKAKSRAIWSNPVIWREIRTRAYGRKVFVIKFAYGVLAVFAALYVSETGGRGGLVLGMFSPVGFAFIGLSIVGLMLINAQAVTALTTERDTKTLELLLATDITAKEFIYGKIGGVFFNTKEVILIPLGLIAYFFAEGTVTGEDFLYLVIGFAVLSVFSAMLGLHAGLSFDNSRGAIANSLGTIFFLFIGIFIFMMLLVEARSSFLLQIQSFVVFIGIGSISLYASLTHKNPSGALTIAAGGLPFLTFFAITEFLLDGNLGVCLAISCAYGFTTLAMLIPAISEFDVALGRTTFDKG